MDTAPRSGCAINAAVEVLGDPWAMLVLRDIMFGNRRYFRELIAGSEEGIATNILASRLKQLVAAGLLTRDDARRGQRAAYSLTEAGIQVLPVMVALGNWGLAHRTGERRLRVRAELLRDGGPELVGGDDRRTARTPPRRPAPQPGRTACQRSAARRLRGRGTRQDDQRGRRELTDLELVVRTRSSTQISRPDRLSRSTIPPSEARPPVPEVPVGDAVRVMRSAGSRSSTTPCPPCEVTWPPTPMSP